MSNPADARPLHEQNALLANLAETASAATVSIGRDGRGSGVVVADGVVLTNAHTLRNATTQVRFADGRTVQATIKATDADGDLATLAVDTSGVTALVPGNATPAAGHLVVAAHGNGAIGVGLVIAADRSFPGPQGRMVRNAFEHSAALARGASGGPVIDVDGNLVGLNTNRTEVGYQAIALVGAGRARLDSLVAGTSFHRPRLGLALADARSAAAVRRAAGLADIDGVLVRAVAEGSPAAAAGLSQGDVITAAAGHATPTSEALLAAIETSAASAAESVELTVVRGVEERTVIVDFGSGTVS